MPLVMGPFYLKFMRVTHLWNKGTLPVSASSTFLFVYKRHAENFKKIWEKR